jgi:hypothetical protein
MEQVGATPEVSRGRRLGRWALVCIGLTPLVWVPGVVASLEIGPQDNPWQVFVPVYVLFLTPAATAFVLACLARRAGRSEVKAAFIGSAVLLAYSVGWSFQEAGGLAMTVVVGLAVALWFGLDKPQRASPEAPGLPQPMSSLSVEATGPGGPRTPSTAMAAFILGLMACLTVIPMGFFFTPPVALPAVIVGVVGLRQAHKRGAPRELAIAGLGYALSALLAVVGITLTTGWA